MKIRREGEKEGTAEGQWNRAHHPSPPESGENKLYSVVCEHEFLQPVKVLEIRGADDKYRNKITIQIPPPHPPIAKRSFFVARRIFYDALTVSRIY